MTKKYIRINFCNIHVHLLYLIDITLNSNTFWNKIFIQQSKLQYSPFKETITPIRPLPLKVIPFIRPDFRYIVIVKYPTRAENHIGGVMVSMLVLSVVYRGFEPWLGQTLTIKFVFFASPLACSIKEKEQRLVGSESGNMSIRRLLFQWARIIKIQLGESSSHWKLTCSSHDIVEKLLSWH
jgi:hypothetical protein